MKTVSSIPVISKPLMECYIQATCMHFGCTEEELIEKDKGQDCVYRRDVCIYLIHSNVVISWGRIAKRFGFKSHSTIMRSFDRIEARKNIYAHIKHDLQVIEQIKISLAN